MEIMMATTIPVWALRLARFAKKMKKRSNLLNFGRKKVFETSFWRYLGVLRPAVEAAVGTDLRQQKEEGEENEIIYFHKKFYTMFWTNFVESKCKIICSLVGSRLHAPTLCFHFNFELHRCLIYIVIFQWFVSHFNNQLSSLDIFALIFIPLKFSTTSVRW